MGKSLFRIIPRGVSVKKFKAKDFVFHRHLDQADHRVIDHEDRPLQSCFGQGQ